MDVFLEIVSPAYQVGGDSCDLAEGFHLLKKNDRSRMKSKAGVLDG